MSDLVRSVIDARAFSYDHDCKHAWTDDEKSHPFLFFSVVQALLQEMCIPMKKQELKELMREVDTDGSGEVDFDEVGTTSHQLLADAAVASAPNT